MFDQGKQGISGTPRRRPGKTCPEGHGQGGAINQKTVSKILQLNLLKLRISLIN